MRLFEFIPAHMELILAEWEEFARAVQPPDRDMDVVELRDHAEDMLEVIAADMQEPQTEAERAEKSKGRQSEQPADTAAETHALGRLDSGFSVKLLASEYRALRASVLKLWSRQGYGNQQHAIDDIIRFNEAIDQALAESIARYSEAAMTQQDVFVGMLSHDLRTPLQSISYGAQFLMHGENRNSQIIQVGARMYNSVKRMTGMIDNLLDFTKSRIGGGMVIKTEETDLSGVAEQVVEEFRSYNPGRQISLAIAGNCNGEWDKGRLAQIYQNLIANALQHGASDTPVTVDTQGLDSEIIIRVHNQGPPIAKQDQQKLFDHLHGPADAKASGGAPQSVGLGLYIVREIAVAHGGSVTVSSSAEEGTEFKVRLPRKAAPSTNAQAPT